MDSQKQQVAERIKQANNILVTVSANPSVDQLAACIGTTLALNKAGKHATAVFSGQVPSTLEFLQPEKTIEKNTDSLRDFIIALDKSKADKLRYKVEDRVVKIFITPYRTSISDKDLEFSQGDFNVDVVLALGVHNQAELDQAITAHGRILHDATVVTINTKPGGELGSINWLDAGASSLSELAMLLIDVIDKKLLDGQIATAILTGIVSETDRFSNEKTAPQTMSISAELMAAGANQQLVATKLEEPPASLPPAPEAPVQGSASQAAPPEAPAAPPKPDDGTLEISHDTAPEESFEAPTEEKSEEAIAPQIHIDEHGSLVPLEQDLPGANETPAVTPENPEPPEAPESKPEVPAKPETSHRTDKTHMIMEPPSMGGQLTAAADSFSATGGLSLPDVEPAGPLLDRQPLQPPTAPTRGHTIMPPHNADESKSSLPELPNLDESTASKATNQYDNKHLGDGQTLAEIEKDVNSPHLNPSDSVVPPAPSIPSAVSPQPSPPFPQQPMLNQPSLSSPSISPASTPFNNLVPPTSSTPQTSQADDGVNVSLPHDTPAPSPVQTPVSPPTAAESEAAEAKHNLSNARDAVQQAINASPGSAQPLPPIEALNAQPLGNAGIPMNAAASAAPTPDLGFAAVPDPAHPAPVVGDFSNTPPSVPGVSQSDAANPSSPPPVPPPMMPPNYPA